MSATILPPLLSRLSIVDKRARVLPLAPNWAQRIAIEDTEEQLRSRGRVRQIALKARQLGFSTITEAQIYALSFVLHNSAALVIANEQDNAQHLLGMTQTYWDTDPFRPLFSTKYQAKNVLQWNETKSHIRTTTAGNKDAGRSKTVRFLHGSEVAFWDNAETVTTGLMQAVPDVGLTIVVLESTANGRGNYFHKMWLQAVRGESEYSPLFFPWWMHYEYRASYVKLPYFELNDYDEEEKALLKLFDAGLQVGDRSFKLRPSEWNDALAWRRWAIFNKCNGDIIKFHQEYPSTPEEAFVATGLNVFPEVHLQKCFEPRSGQRGRLMRKGAEVEFVPDPMGPLTIYKFPSTNRELGHYCIGGDATATMRGDYAVAEVINRRTFEQVAEYRARIDPAHFGEELAKLGTFYNTAILAPENEGPGFATIGWLQNLDYPNMFQSTIPDGLPGRYVGKYGWSQSYRTKDLAVGWLLRLLIEHGTIIHSRKLYDEMDNYVTLEGGGYGNAAGEEHDDTVMAFAIAVAASIMSGQLPAYGSVELTSFKDDDQPVWASWEDQSVTVYG